MSVGFTDVCKGSELPGAGNGATFAALTGAMLKIEASVVPCVEF